MSDPALNNAGNTVKDSVLANPHVNGVPLLEQMGATFEEDDLFKIGPASPGPVGKTWRAKFEALLAHGLNPQAYHADWGTLWHRCAPVFHAPTFERLQELGVDPTLENPQGDTVLAIVLGTLQGHTLDRFSSHAPQAPLAEAYFARVIETSPELRASLAEETAAYDCQVEWVYRLIALGCDPFARNAQGKRAIDRIQWGGSLDWELHQRYPHQPSMSVLHAMQQVKPPVPEGYGPRHRSLVEDLEKRSGQVFFDHRPLSEVFAFLAQEQPWVPSLPPRQPSFYESRTQDPERLALLNVVGQATFETRVPHVALVIQSEGSFRSELGTPIQTLTNLVAQGFVAWYHDRVGWLHQVQPRNPATGKVLSSASLHLTEKALEVFGEDLYAGHLNVTETEAYRCLRKSRTEWEQQMRRFIAPNRPSLKAIASRRSRGP